MAFQKHRDDAEQNQKQHDDEQDEAVAGDALLVAHRAQAVDAAVRPGSSRGADSWWSGRAGGCGCGSTAPANHICARPVRCNGRRTRPPHAPGVDWVLISSKTGSCAAGAGAGADFSVTVRNGRAVRNGGGTEFGRGRALDLRVELFDLGFERGDLVVERAGAVGNRVNFFLRTPYDNFNAAPKWR